MNPRRVTLTSPKLLKQKKRKRIIFTSVFFGSSVALFIILYLFFNLKFLLIKNVTVEGNEITDTSNVQNIVMSYMEGKYFYFIPKSNKLIYPKEDLILEIKKNINRVEKISLDVSKNTLLVKIGERDASALWCKESECYFMDKYGYIFSKAPDFSPGVYLTFEGVIFDENPQGKYFLDNEKITDINSIVDFLKEKSLKVSKVKVNTLKDVEVSLERGFVVKVDLTKEIENSIKILKTVLSSSEFKKSVNNLSELGYIDIRFGNKVFFKQNTSSVPSVSTVSQ